MSHWGTGINLTVPEDQEQGTGLLHVTPEPRGTLWDRSVQKGHLPEVAWLNGTRIHI